MKWSIVRDITIVVLLGFISLQFYTTVVKLSDLSRAVTGLIVSSNSGQQEGIAASLTKVYNILDAAEILSPRYGIYKENEFGQAMGRPVYRRVHSNEIAREELQERLKSN